MIFAFCLILSCTMSYDPEVISQLSEEQKNQREQFVYDLIGQVIVNGEITSRVLIYAVSAFDKACSAGNEDSCFKSAQGTYQKNERVIQDFNVLKTELKKETAIMKEWSEKLSRCCSVKFPDCCSNYVKVQLTLNYDKLEKDLDILSRSKQMLQKGCPKQQANNRACEMLKGFDDL